MKIAAKASFPLSGQARETMVLTVAKVVLPRFSSVLGWVFCDTGYLYTTFFENTSNDFLKLAALLEMDSEIRIKNYIFHGLTTEIGFSINTK